MNNAAASLLVLVFLTACGTYTYTHTTLASGRVVGPFPSEAMSQEWRDRARSLP